MVTKAIDRQNKNNFFTEEYTACTPLQVLNVFADYFSVYTRYKYITNASQSIANLPVFKRNFGGLEKCELSTYLQNIVKIIRETNDRKIDSSGLP